jgi:hypothetical protein
MKERTSRAFMRVPIHQRTLSEIEFQVQLAGVSARGYLNRATILGEVDSGYAAYRNEIRAVLRELHHLEDRIHQEGLMVEDAFKTYRQSRLKNLRKKHNKDGQYELIS